MIKNLLIIHEELAIIVILVINGEKPYADGYLKIFSLTFLDFQKDGRYNAIDVEILSFYVMRSGCSIDCLKS